MEETVERFGGFENKTIEITQSQQSENRLNQ